MDELSEDDKLTVARARKVQRFMSQPFTVAEVFTGTKGVFVSLEDTIKGFQEILSGQHDDLPEGAFYMVRVQGRVEGRGESEGISTEEPSHFLALLFGEVSTRPWYRRLLHQATYLPPICMLEMFRSCLSNLPKRRSCRKPIRVTEFPARRTLRRSLFSPPPPALRLVVPFGMQVGDIASVGEKAKQLAESAN